MILHIVFISLCLATMLTVQDDNFIQGDLCASCPTLLVSHWLTRRPRWTWWIWCFPLGLPELWEAHSVVYTHWTNPDAGLGAQKNVKCFCTTQAAVSSFPCESSFQKSSLWKASTLAFESSFPKSSLWKASTLAFESSFQKGSLAKASTLDFQRSFQKGSLWQASTVNLWIAWM